LPYGRELWAQELDALDLGRQFHAPWFRPVAVHLLMEVAGPVGARITSLQRQFFESLPVAGIPSHRQFLQQVPDGRLPSTIESEDNAALVPPEASLTGRNRLETPA
jgi:hypothetical protein